MLCILCLIGSTLCLGEMVPHDLERLEAALETAAKEGTQDLKIVVRQGDPFYSLPKTHHFLNHFNHQAPPPAPTYSQPPAPPAAPAITWPLKPPTPHVSSQIYIFI